MLHIYVYDAKSSYQNMLQYKDCSAFDRRPKYCPLLAWKRQKAKSQRSYLFRDAAGKPWESDQLSSKFKGFIEHLQNTDVLPKHKKYSWHVWRVSFLNIALTEFGVPIYLCQEVASHRPGSTETYVSRTGPERKARAAMLVADRAQYEISKRKKKRKKKKKKSKTRKRKLPASFPDPTPRISPKHANEISAEMHERLLRALSPRKRTKT